MSFDSLGLQAELVRAVHDKGYSVPTPIQQQAIPVVLQGRDLMGGAQTGTGKTAGFTLPMLQRLQGRAPAGHKPGSIRALVVTPTRELAAQVFDSIQDYGRHLRLRSAVIFGGVNINPQTRALKQGVDIVVATPGRLLDHVAQGNVDLSRVEILVLDEADRMLDMGFIHDIRKILARLPDQRQTLLFSATFSAEIKKLADGLLKNPALVEVTPVNSTTDSVAQTVHPVDKQQKRALLSYLIGSNNWQQVLVFNRTKHGANRLAEQLGRDGITAAAIHGNKSQGARNRALADFKSGRVRVLVATDIAARGLDIQQLPHVVNFELPNVAEDYVHRIGRTGRAGRSGEAMSLVCAEERKLLKDIEKLIKRPITQRIVAGYEPSADFDSVAAAVDDDQRNRGRRRRQTRGSSGRPAMPAAAGKRARNQRQRSQAAR